MSQTPPKDQSQVEHEAQSTYTVSSEVQELYSAMLSEAHVQRGMKFLKADQDTRVAEQIELTEIPAPPFNEQARAKEYARRMTQLGLKDVYIDDEGNAIGLWKGTQRRPKLVVSAHLDTVFPKGYNAKVTKDEDGILHAPGISDDGSGLAGLLSIVRAMKASGVETVGDILFVGDVGEEGRGDLRGIKHLFSTIDDIDGFISIDGTRADKITYQGLSSKRFEFNFIGPGGHSYGAFGDIPSPIHAMGRAINKIADIQVPTSPKTTFTVSVVNGGTSVNSIAAQVSMQTDTRSECPKQLEKTVAEVVNAVKMSVIEENARWQIPWDSKDNIRVEITLVGDRPGGFAAKDALHVQSAYAATKAIGQEPELFGPGSTDANIPISLDVPALAMGAGGTGGKIHSPDEYFDPADAWLGPQRVFLIMLSLIGINGTTAPLLIEHPGYNYTFTGVIKPEDA